MGVKVILCASPATGVSSVSFPCCVLNGNVDSQLGEVARIYGSGLGNAQKSTCLKSLRI